MDKFVTKMCHNQLLIDQGITYVDFVTRYVNIVVKTKFSETTAPPNEQICN